MSTSPSKSLSADPGRVVAGSFTALRRGLAVLVTVAALLLTIAPSAVAQSEREQSVDRESLARLVAVEKERAARRAEIEARAVRMGLPLHQELPDGTVLGLQGFDGQRPIYFITDNLNAAATVSTDEVRPGGGLGLSLDGDGELLGEWDGGSPRLTHQEFGGRATNMDGAGGSTHSTHVAGTMIAAGVNASALGMSPKASLRSYDFFDDTMEMAAEQMGPDPVKISNHSYGFISGWRNNFFGDGLWVWFGDIQTDLVEDSIFGLYLEAAMQWDQIAYDSPYYLIVKSAGNDRGEGPSGTVNHWHFDSSVGPDGDFVMDSDSHPVDGGATGYDTIGGGGGSAKNILTIGAVSDIPGGWTDPSDVVMSSFSGWGPTDDGRIKPDLVANGVSLFSSSNSSDTGYTNLSGTSMSTPNAAGSIGLLHQHANNLFGMYYKAATMRALTIHTASEAGNAGPDYTFGWGLLDTAGAADVLSAQTGQNDYFFHMAEETLSDGGTYTKTISSDGTGPLAVTMAWTDPPGAEAPGGVLDPPDPNLVNDLDLRIIGPDSTVYEPWILDPANPADPATVGDNTRDAVEQVWIAAPGAGNYTLEVTHKGGLVQPTAEGAGVQDFSLVVTGHFDPLVFTDGFESGDLSGWSSNSP